MKKIVGLDLGEAWIGSAIADPLGITCRPYQTVTTKELADLLTKVITEERIGTMVIGLPKDQKGGLSEQAKKLQELFNKVWSDFAQHHDTVEVIWWDERMSSQRAVNHQISVQKKQKRTKKEKLSEHSLAAAFVLQSYLDYRANT